MTKKFPNHGPTDRPFQGNDKIIAAYLEKVLVSFMGRLHFPGFHKVIALAKAFRSSPQPG